MQLLYHGLPLYSTFQPCEINVTPTTSINATANRVILVRGKRASMDIENDTQLLCAHLSLFLFKNDICKNSGERDC